MARAGIAVMACVLGYACGQAVTRRPPRLPTAGSPRDDGSGLLARLSTDGLVSAGQGRPGEAGRAGASYGGAAYGAAGATYGGSIYANFRFDYTAPGRPQPTPYGGRYRPRAALSNTGSVEGVVLWPHPPRALDRLPATAPQSGPCAAGVPNQTLAVGSGGGVADAVVYLDKIDGGRATLGRVNAYSYNASQHLQLGGVVEWRGCRFRPHVQVAAPVGAVLDMSTADAALALTATRIDGSVRQSLWSVELGAPGAAREIQLDHEGFVELAPRGGAAGAARGWVVVAPHPYYVVTDQSGHFTLPGIPPGTYELVVWHEPVVVGAGAGGHAVVTRPVLVRRSVTILARKSQRVVVRLPTVSSRAH